MEPQGQKYAHLKFDNVKHPLKYCTNLPVNMSVPDPNDHHS